MNWLMKRMEKYNVDPNAEYLVAEVTKKFGLSEATISRYIRDGKLVALRMGNKWRITGQSLRDYLVERMSVAKEKKKEYGDLYNLTKASKLIGISVRTMYRWSESGKAVTVDINGSPFITKVEIDRLKRLS